MSVLNTPSLFREVKWQRLESRVKEPLKFNVPIFGSYTLPACEKKNKASTSTNKLQNIMDLNLFL